MDGPKPSMRRGDLLAATAASALLVAGFVLAEAALAETWLAALATPLIVVGLTAAGLPLRSGTRLPRTGHVLIVGALIWAGWAAAIHNELAGPAMLWAVRAAVGAAIWLSAGVLLRHGLPLGLALLPGVAALADTIPLDLPGGSGTKALRVIGLALGGTALGLYVRARLPDEAHPYLRGLMVAAILLLLHIPDDATVLLRTVLGLAPLGVLSLALVILGLRRPSLATLNLGTVGLTLTVTSSLAFAAVRGMAIPLLASGRDPGGIGDRAFFLGALVAAILCVVNAWWLGRRHPAWPVVRPLSDPMRRRTLRFAIAAGLALLALAATGARLADAAVDERARIEALVAAVEASDVTFVRNGRNHTAAEAAGHLRAKWRAAASRIKTAEAFIEGVGSRSSTSGRPYEVILQDGRRREAGPWLRDLLAEVDRRR